MPLVKASSGRLLKLSLGVIFSALLYLGALSQDGLPTQTVITQIENGYIKGYKERGSFVFRGTPYSAPRTGANRFKAPEKHRDWQDTLSCLKNGSSAAQIGTQEKPVRGSEDGLFLNVFTPTLLKNTKLPVLVWVHGGSMVSGTGSAENGHAFSDKDSIVTVSINYRLGALGFLYLSDLGPSYASSANNGLLDLIQALKWVKENIHAFGGDASRVSVMGESAGAKLTSALIAAPQAAGLYSGMILESGGLQCIRDIVTAKQIRKRLMDTLAIQDPRQLLDMPLSQLMAAQGAVLGGAKGTNYFGPVIDGEVIKMDGYKVLAAEGKSKVHYLLGANQNESEIFINMDKRLYQPDSTVMADWFGNNYRYFLSDYHKALKRLGKAVDTPMLTRLLSQYMYQLHTHRLARQLAAAGRDIWLYDYGFPPAHHGSELRYVWMDPAPGNYLKIESDFGRTLHQYWVQFIQNGQPGSVGNINWPSYGPKSECVMQLEAPFRIKKIKRFFNNKKLPSACFLLTEEPK